MSVKQLNQPLKWRVNRQKELYEVKGSSDTEWMSLGVSKSEFEELKNQVSGVFEGATIKVVAGDNNTTVVDNRPDSKKKYKISEIKNKDFLFNDDFTIQSNPGYAIGYILLEGYEPSTQDWCTLNSFIINIHNYTNDFIQNNFKGHNLSVDSIFKLKSKNELKQTTYSYSFYNYLSEEVNVAYSEYRFTVKSYPIYLGKPSFQRVYLNRGYLGSIYFNYNDNTKEEELYTLFGFVKTNTLTNDDEMYDFQINQRGNDFVLPYTIENKTLTIPNSTITDTSEQNYKVLGFACMDRQQNGGNRKWQFDHIYTSDVTADMGFISDKDNLTILCYGETDELKPQIIFLTNEEYEKYTPENKDEYYDDMKKYVLTQYSYSYGGEKLISTIGGDYNYQWSYTDHGINNSIEEYDGSWIRRSMMEWVLTINSGGSLFNENTKIAILWVDGQFGGDISVYLTKNGEERTNNVKVSSVQNKDNRKLFTLHGKNVYITEPLSIPANEIMDKIALFYGIEAY